jgi:type I restriction enzyme, R subunit
MDETVQRRLATKTGWMTMSTPKTKKPKKDAAPPPLAPRQLGNEAKTVQYPLVEHAREIGWEPVSKTDALRLRGGEAGAFFYEVLRSKLIEFNPGLVTGDNVQSIIDRMEAVPKTIAGNREILEWLRGNRTTYDERDKRHRNVRVVDFEHADRNAFHVTTEWTSQIPGRKANRADILFLLNGVPIAIVENKNPKKGDALDRGISQLRRYELETPELMVTPQVFNVTHLIHYHYGVTWNYARKNIFNWKSKPDESYRSAIQSFFERTGFLKLLAEWLLFFVKDDELQKTVLRQHQTRAVERVIARCADPTRQRGLVWHTQGSGKTFTLVTAGRLILEDRLRFPGATVILVVDRNELEGQLSGWVARLLGEMRGAGIAVAEADTKAQLQDLLDGDFRGLIISMIHKFEGLRKDSSTRDDIFVFIDEAHRSTEGDLGNYLTGALPNATLIGLTGTPIDKTEHGKGTFKVFGKDDPEGYLDKYSIRESIEDGTTVKLRHTLVPTELSLPQDILEKEFYALTEAEGISDIEELNRILDRAVRLKAVLKADARIDATAGFMAQHFRENVEPLGYKAFVVAVDREACALYKQALDKYLPPEYTVPVYTRNAADAIERPLVASLQLDEAREKDVRKNFPKPDKLPKIFVVTDKLLTGYDAPILYCMYLDKPMRDHVLLQAVARVNRPYEDEQGVRKPCGLVVDFVGVLRDLKKALAFDSKDVSGVIEDLDLLLSRFREIMDGAARRYLDAMSGPGSNDVVLEELLYKRFLDPERRREFAELYKEIEELYEILSPSPELRDYILPYNRLADLYVMLRNAYGAKAFYYGEVAHKTERLVRETATMDAAYRVTRTAEFDARALEALQRRGTSDEGKIVNLVRTIEQEAEREGDRAPHLRSITERATELLQLLEERQLSTEDALKEIERLLAEREEAERARRESGLDAAAFAAYWVLRKEFPGHAIATAREIGAVRGRFPEADRNADEYRQMKAEIYKVLLRIVKGHRMVDLTEQILALPWQ